MKWFLGIVGTLAVAIFFFLPTLREPIFELFFGDVIKHVCVGETGVILNGTYSLSEEAAKGLTAVCTVGTKKFKDMAEKVENTSWSEYYDGSDISAITLVKAEIERALVIRGWTKTKIGSQNGAFKEIYEKDGHKIVLYGVTSAKPEENMFFISGN